MDAIQQHIDYLFQDLPDTTEIKQIKNDLYLNATDRYKELIGMGKTDTEALGTIIIEMGERDDLLESLDYDQEEDLKEHSVNSLEEARYFIASNTQEATKVSLGILLILIGAGLISTASTFGMAELGVILLLILVAVAVGLFINAGLKLEDNDKVLYADDNVFFMTNEDYKIVSQEFGKFKQTGRYRIPLGVMLCIVSVIPILYFSFVENEFLIERYGVVLLTTIVGIGVFQFVTYGMVHSAYEKILNLGEYSYEERQFQKRIEPIASIYWLVMTLIYFVWSFAFMSWYISWIIWPIAGVLWGIVVMFLKMRYDRN